MASRLPRLLRPAALGAALAAVAADLPAPPPGIPPGWWIVAEEHFDTPESLARWEMADPSAWRFSADSQSRSLELVRQSRYQPPVRSPLNLAVLSGTRCAEVIFEADLMQTGPEYPHRDMVLAFCIQDASHFYYAHLASAADEHAHNVFLVNGADRVKIGTRTTPGIRWGDGEWHRVRVERRTSTGAIRVFFDDMAKPVMEAEDKTLGIGAIGFGSFDDTGKVDNVRVWSPTDPGTGPRVYEPGAGGRERGAGSGEKKP